jgi:hypothetical protein
VFIYRAIWFLRYADAEYYDAYYVRPRGYTRWKKIVLRRAVKKLKWQKGYSTRSEISTKVEKTARKLFSRR